jgi:hypothetical protein
MLSCDFHRKIRKLNPHFRIISNERPDFPAGLYYVDARTGPMQVCGVDKNYIPEHTIWNKQFIAKGGWRRTLNIIHHKGLAPKRLIEKVFSTHLDVRKREARGKWVDPIQDALNQAVEHGEQVARRKFGVENSGHVELDDLLQIHRMRKRARGEA